MKGSSWWCWSVSACPSLGRGLLVSTTATTGITRTTSSPTPSSHLGWSRVVMAGLLVLSASANNDEYTKSPCDPPCRWPQECNYESTICECRITPCNRVFNQETTTLRSWRPPPTPHGPGPADYSGVVKLALGAAIVMLAGVILALVWNLYRERRRAAQGLTRPPSNRRRRQQAQRNSGLPHSHDLPPSYNDIFIISGAEAGRRHEKPPSYEEAMQDQQFAVVAPLAFVNYGFTGEGGPMGPSRRPPGRNAEASGVASALLPSFEAATASLRPSLNVASIMNRLGSTPTRLPRSVSDCGPGRSTVPTIILTECESVDNVSPYPPTNYDGLNVRRTKSGRAPHRRSANDLTRTESMASVTESCCSVSDISGEVSDNVVGKSQGAECIHIDTTVLPNRDCAEDALRCSTTSDKSSPSLPRNDRNHFVTINQFSDSGGGSTVAATHRSGSPVNVQKNSTLEGSQVCETASVKMPDNDSAPGSRPNDTVLPMGKDEVHSNGDVSFC